MFEKITNPLRFGRTLGVIITGLIVVLIHGANAQDPVMPAGEFEKTCKIGY